MNTYPDYFETILRESLLGDIKYRILHNPTVRLFFQGIDLKDQRKQIPDLVGDGKEFVTIHSCNPYSQDEALLKGADFRNVAKRYIVAIDSIIKNKEWETTRARFGSGIYQSICDRHNPFINEKPVENADKDGIQYGTSSNDLAIKFKITDTSKYIVLPNDTCYSHGYSCEGAFLDLYPMIKKVHPDMQLDDYQYDLDDCWHDEYVVKHDKVPEEVANMVKAQYEYIGHPYEEGLPLSMSEMEENGPVGESVKLIDETSKISKVTDGIIYFEPRYGGWVAQTFNQDTIEVLGGILNWSEYIPLEKC